jgi:hypothetical protein
MEDDAPYEVMGVESATPDRDGAYVILTFRMNGSPLNLAIQTPQLSAIVALLSQAANQAFAIGGNVAQQEALETVGTEVFRAGDKVDIHCRLAGGLDLPIGLTARGATDLREQLAVSLASR